MARCKYCHTVHKLDSKGRCPSCALCGKPITRPNAKTCPDCKDEYARAYSREYKRSKKQKGNAK